MPWTALPATGSGADGSPLMAAPLSQAVAMEGIAALCTHNTPSEFEIFRVGLLTKLVGFARARQAPN